MTCSVPSTLDMTLIKHSEGLVGHDTQCSSTLDMILIEHSEGWVGYDTQCSTYIRHDTDKTQCRMGRT